MTYREYFNQIPNVDFVTLFHKSICERYFEKDRTGDCVRGKEYNSCMDCVVDFLNADVIKTNFNKKP